MKMEKKITWKDRCDMQIKNFVNSTMTIYGCTEEQVYEVIFKGLCSIQMFELADELLGKDEE